VSWELQQLAALMGCWTQVVDDDGQTLDLLSPHKVCDMFVLTSVDGVTLMAQEVTAVILSLCLPQAAVWLPSAAVETTGGWRHSQPSMLSAQGMCQAWHLVR